MKKRGISPLIASVLLLLLVISIFSVVFVFIKKTHEKPMQAGAQKIEKIFNCEDVSLEIGKICYDETYSYSEGTGIRIGITVKNNNNFELNNFRIKLSSGETDIIYPDPPVIEPYGVAKAYAGSDEWKTNINLIKLYPIISGATCSLKEHEINLEGADPCPL